MLIAEGMVLKVADFGSSKELDEDEYYQKLTRVRNNSLVFKICFEHPVSSEMYAVGCLYQLVILLIVGQ